MLDFFDIESKKDDKKETITLYPSFFIKRSKDLMTKGHSFYAIWDEDNQMWSTDERRACEIIDRELDVRERELRQDPKNNDYSIIKMGLNRYKSRQYTEWKSYCTSIPDSYKELDSNIVFENDIIVKEDYASKRLSYSMVDAPCYGYDELMSVLYAPEERDKIEWAIGSIIAGDSKQIQKFIVFYGDPGSGKSTVLNIISMLFEGYCSVFDAKSLGSSTSSFSLEPFKNNPLISIQHDGDLSKIEDNTRLNSIVAHEKLVVNEKHKSTYDMRFNTMLFIGTNEPVRITDSRSGVIRRLLDVNPTGNILPINKYNAIMERIPFELGAIANHCYKRYREMGKNYYQNYKPIAMMGLTNDFYSFIDDNIDFFIENGEYITLTKVWDKYKVYCEQAGVNYRLPMRLVKRELKSYYKSYMDRFNGLRKVYFGFKADKFNYIFEKEHEDEKPYALSFDCDESVIDRIYKDCPAQYANAKEKPSIRWKQVKTKLSSIDTHEVHYVKLPENHIVIDFDLKNEKGEKDFERNLEAASKWPSTYAELSKSGAGIHLHYIYEGDVNELSNVYAEDIEIKKFTGNSSLRRKLTKCNNLPIEKISSGLPKKGAKKLVSQNVIETEAQLRGLIRNCLLKKHHGHTKPEIDYIYSELEKAYSSGMHYDVRDMHKKVSIFGASSSNQSIECMKIISKMKFCSADCADPVEDKEAPIVFFDCEVFMNLFVICWMFDTDEKVNKMINPSPEDVESLFKYNLVGFNNRRYDNHILYARATRGYTNEELYKLSQQIVNGKKGENSVLFKEAYNLSYTDIYDFASTKQSLKKWEIELGIHHQENEYPWDKPVPEDKWEEVVEYCCNDVIATKTLFHHLHADFNARKILAELTGLTPNATNLQIITKMIVGNDKNPPLVYTDLSETFPGYEFVQLDDGRWHNMYRGTDLGFGGYVYAEPGMYTKVALLDVGNMHGASICELDKFGPYTQNYRDLREARMAIKRRDYEKLEKMFDGKFMKYVETDEDADNLQTALKLVLNSTYGIAAATFENPLRDNRDRNNTIALRGALMMRTLQDEIVKKGFTVAHIKTDSIKIPNATDEIIDFVIDFGRRYGYEFEHEATYEKMCLVNDAVYIAKYDDKGIRNKGGKHAGEWTATGAEFQVPFVFKTLFSHEKLEFKDFCETRSVMKGELYLDFNEKLPDGEHDYKFVGKVGQFCPVKPGEGGGILYRVQDNKYYAATGTKGFRWIEAETLKNCEFEDKIDMEYFKAQADSAIEHIGEFGDFELFTKEEDMSWLYVPEGTPDEVPFNSIENDINPPEE